MNMKELFFKCPKCKSEMLEEILFDVTQSTTIRKVYVDNGEIDMDYGNASTEGGELGYYQCAECGFRPLTKEGLSVCRPEQVVEWLEKNGTVKES